MKVIDITGLICNGMWTFGSLFPRPSIVPNSGFCPGFGEYYYTAFEGFHAQVGTYIETPAHFYGLDKEEYLMEKIPVEKLYEMRCSILKVDMDVSDPTVQKPITLDMLLKAAEGCEIKEGDCILVSTGWEQHWMDDANFYDHSPYFTYDAMQWIIKQRPAMLATDTPSWECQTNPGGVFEGFYEANILMMVPVANMAEVTAKNAKITALPIKAKGCSDSPCRVVIIED